MIEQTFIQSESQDDPLLRDLFPMVDADADRLLWEQRDNVLGMMQVRGINGSPPRVKTIGANRFETQSGYYGEFMPIDEEEMTRRRQLGQWNGRVDIGELIVERQSQMAIRRMTRVRYICWSLVTSGYFSVPTADGVIVHTDSYNQRRYFAPAPWATVATAGPLRDFRAVQRMQRGYSTLFGVNARAYMNTQTLEYLLSNTNSGDIAGRRTQGLGSYNNLGQMNELLAGDGLPRIVPYDGGYLDDNGVFQLFLPDNVVVVIGQRTTGARIGEFRMTRNVQNANMAPGPYATVIDTLGRTVPRHIEVHAGFNGGPVLYFPSSIVVMYV